MPSNASIAISIVQMKPKLGNINLNASKILEFYEKSNAEIVLFPELSLTGYSPRDKLLSDAFIQECHAKIDEILMCIGEKICIIGTPFFESNKLYNAVIAMQHGSIIAKSFLVKKEKTNEWADCCIKKMESRFENPEALEKDSKGAASIGEECMKELLGL